jgi:hypothetical protein
MARKKYFEEKRLGLASFQGPRCAPTPLIKRLMVERTARLLHGLTLFSVQMAPDDTTVERTQYWAAAKIPT